MWIEGFDAAGFDGETREVALRIRMLLDRGVPPEDIAVVVRRPEGYALAIRRRFSEFGIPFSGGHVPAPLTPAGRRVLAVLTLCEQGERAVLDRWLSALGPMSPLGSAGGKAASAAPLQTADLKLGLRVAGAARLGDVARLDVESLLTGHSTLPLPVRRSGTARSEGEEETDDLPEPSDNPRRQLPKAVLSAAVSWAKDRPAGALWGRRMMSGERFSGDCRLQSDAGKQVTWRVCAQISSVTKTFLASEGVLPPIPNKAPGHVMVMPWRVAIGETKMTTAPAPFRNEIVPLSEGTKRDGAGLAKANWSKGSARGRRNLVPPPKGMPAPAG